MVHYVVLVKKKRQYDKQKLQAKLHAWIIPGEETKEKDMMQKTKNNKQTNGKSALLFSLV